MPPTLRTNLLARNDRHADASQPRIGQHRGDVEGGKCHPPCGLICLPVTTGTRTPRNLVSASTVATLANRECSSAWVQEKRSNSRRSVIGAPATGGLNGALAV